MADRICKNCGCDLQGDFCAHCGQDASTELHDLRGWLGEIASQIFDLDFKLARTLKRLAFSPGALTLEYVSGRRQPFTHPFKLYLIVSAVAITVMSAMGVMQLDSLLQNADPEALRQIEELFGISSLSDAQVQQRFDARFNILFPIFNLFTPLGICLALKLVDRKTLLHAHAVFALHIASAQVGYSMLLLPFLEIPPAVQATISLALVAGLSVYFIVALRRVYGGGWGATLLKMIVLTVTYVVIVNVISLLAFAAVLPTL